jgi:hypothetical protein
LFGEKATQIIHEKDDSAQAHIASQKEEIAFLRKMLKTK